MSYDDESMAYKLVKAFEKKNENPLGKEQKGVVIYIYILYLAR